LYRFDDDDYWTLLLQTGGLINNRYANQDAQEIKNQLTGRGDIAATEIDMF
jgi:hypothetical protein